MSSSQLFKEDSEPRSYLSTWSVSYVSS